MAAVGPEYPALGCDHIPKRSGRLHQRLRETRLGKWLHASVVNTVRLRRRRSSEEIPYVSSPRLSVASQITSIWKKSSLEKADPDVPSIAEGNAAVACKPAKGT
ncbi:hypothetical protein ANO14919_080840 [Xylariales sp. No.14919]|nr:hypothetical protein ANO14919_080840 [Xylariales sp. No.14919]